MKNKAFAVGIHPRLYHQLAMQSKLGGDFRHPDELVNLAIRHWLAIHSGASDHHGYQWKDLFLPNGTELRLCYRGEYHYAHIADDQLLYADQPLSPHAWAQTVTGTVRNAWRDIWIRRSVHEPWTRANVWRPRGASQLCYPLVNRRYHARRSND